LAAVDLLTLKRRFNFLFLAITIVAISFSINVDIRLSDRVQDFYSPLTRFWELMMGSILAYLTLHKINIWDNAMQMLSAVLGKSSKVPKPSEIVLRNVQSLMGVLLIGIAFCCLTKDRLFPGWWHCCQLWAHYLIISAGQHAWLNRTVLSASSNGLVWPDQLPALSLALPLLSFARIIESGAPSVNILVAASLSSIALAWLTYKLIEKTDSIF